jgi:hypothetical protein
MSIRDLVVGMPVRLLGMRRPALVVTIDATRGIVGINFDGDGNRYKISMRVKPAELVAL